MKTMRLAMMFVALAAISAESYAAWRWKAYQADT